MKLSYAGMRKIKSKESKLLWLEKGDELGVSSFSFNTQTSLLRWINPNTRISKCTEFDWLNYYWFFNKDTDW